MSGIKCAGIFLVILWITCSCEQKKQTESTKTGSVNTHTLATDSTLAFDIDKKTSLNNYFYDVLNIDGEEFLALINRNINGIQIYSIADRKLYKKIQFPEEGPDGFPRLRAFTFVNPDSIFIVSLYAKDLWLVDIDGQIKKKYNAQNQGQPLFNLGAGFYSGVKPIYFNGKLYIHAFSKAVDSFNLAFFEPDNKIEIEIDPRNETWNYLDIGFPPLYEGNLWIGDISRDVGKDGTLVYSSAVNPEVTTYSLVDKKADAHKADSRFINNIEPLLVSGDQNAMSRYFVETPRYTSLAYDKYNDVYYRFVRHELPTVDPKTGQRTEHDDAPFSIIILDSSFNQLGETKMEDLKHNMNAYFITKDGLYISNTNPKNPDLNEDVLSFTLFKLRKIE